jgi:tol-pal system protein YbgF
MCIMRRNARIPAARALGVVAAAVFLGGCATKSDVRSLQIELRDELRAQAARQDSLLALLRRETASTQDTLLRTQSDQLFDFRGDITRVLQALQQGQARLEAMVGENQRGIAAMRSQGVVAGRPTGAAPLVDVGPSTGPVAGATGGNETVAGVGGGNADQLYNIARDQDQRGSLAAAQQAYEQFLADYPNDARAPDGYWFLGDLLERQNRPDDALEKFQEIPTRWPTAARVPATLFRIARIQVDLGDRDDARATLERLVNTYPDSDMASFAREMLEDLN